jgi:peptidoglycan-N-acetylglucosamine deacetylase
MKIRITKKNRLIAIAGLIALLLILVSLPPVQAFFGVSRVATQAKVVALTYDDGPYPPYTQQLLAILQRNQVKATFYEIGQRIQAHPQVARQVFLAGHELGNHSYSHQSMWLRSPEFLANEIDSTNRLLKAAGVTSPPSFRPPWGRRLLMLPYLLHQRGERLVIYDVDSVDYGAPNVEFIVNNVVNQVQPGSIVLMHDGGGDRSKTVAAAEIIIQRLRAKGYQFKTISELFSLQS